MVAAHCEKPWFVQEFEAPERIWPAVDQIAGGNNPVSGWVELRLGEEAVQNFRVPVQVPDDDVPPGEVGGKPADNNGRSSSRRWKWMMFATPGCDQLEDRMLKPSR